MNAEHITTIREALRRERVRVEMSDLDINHKAREFARIDAAFAALGGPTTLGEGKWEPKVSEGYEYSIVMCPEGGELNIYDDGWVVVKEGSKMYQFRFPPGCRIWHDVSSPLALAEQQVKDEREARDGKESGTSAVL